MEHERSDLRNVFHEKALSVTEIVSACAESSRRRKRDQSLFKLLLEIDSRLRTEGRNDHIERKRSKGKERQRLGSTICPVIASSR